jgi:CHAD domain-containing protein
VRSTRYALLLLRIGRALATIGAAAAEATEPPPTLSRFATRLLNKRRRALLRHIEANPEPDAQANENQQLKPHAGRATSHGQVLHAGPPDAAALHAARISAKKLRYCAEFFGALYKPKQVRRFTRALAALQDSLGAVNDAAVARSLLGQLAAAYPGRFDAATLARIEGWLAGGTSARLESLPAAWQAWHDQDRFW